MESRRARDGKGHRKTEGEVRDSDRERAQMAGTAVQIAVRIRLGEVEEGRTPLTWRQRRQSPRPGLEI